jgi:hypothetical protein
VRVRLKLDNLPHVVHRYEPVYNNNVPILLLYFRRTEPGEEKRVWKESCIQGGHPTLFQRMGIFASRIGIEPLQEVSRASKT